MAPSVAAIFAHPDDEVLACGGALARHARAGSDVHILLLSTGSTSRDPNNLAYVGVLREQAKAASKILGARSIEFADFPDNRMDTVALLDVVRKIEKFLDAAQAEIIYTHWSGDLNIDHGVVARAVMTAARPLPESRVRRILAGEVQSSSEYASASNRFRPSSYIGIVDTLGVKLEALSCYTEELHAFPHPRSLQAVEYNARLRGAEAGLAAAEAFTVLRDIKI